MISRSDFRAARKSLSKEERRKESEAICQKILSWPLYQKAKCVMAYIPSASEADILPVVRDALKNKKTLLLPRCVGEGIMHAHPLLDFSLLTPGLYGILEPPISDPFPKENIDLILTPGLAFDRKLNRLGQGGGYYDRFLRDFPGVCAGIAFRIQVVDTLETKPHDVPLDALITPEEIIVQRKERI